MDLSTWSESVSPTGAWQWARLTFGAKPYRCEYCRHNFVSFRPRKERFSFSRWRNLRGKEAVRAESAPK